MIRVDQAPRRIGSEPRLLDEATFRSVPWKSTRVVFIAIQGGACTYAKNVTEKRELLQHLKPRAKLLMGWPGEWSQDVFDITKCCKQIEF